MRDLEDVAGLVTHHCSPITVRGVERLFQAHRSGSKCSPINTVTLEGTNIRFFLQPCPFA